MKNLLKSKTARLIAIVGPTGSGKTALAVALAKKFNGVIISADSRQVYRGLDVGTNKEGVPGVWPLDPARDKPLDFSTSLEVNPARDKNGQPCRIIKEIPQLLIDITSPGERFTLNNWLIQAKYALKRLFKADQLPIIVGGTGLYVTALLEGYEPGGGRFAKNNQPVDFQSLVLMPDAERGVLYQRSDKRIVRIFDQLVAETRELLSLGVSADWLDRIGLDYRYALKGIRGNFKRNEIIEQYCRASRQYIRRQLTWWRHHGEPVAVRSNKEAAVLARDFLLS